MDIILSYSDWQHIILVKLCFFLFLTLGLIGIYKKAKISYFLVILGLCSALAYFFLVHGMGLMFWGQQGDEVFVSGLYNMASQGSIFSDFVYPDFPPFYPPLFFVIFGLLGRMFSWNGIQIAKAVAFSTFLFYPVIFYWVQKLFWNKNKGDKTIPGNLAMFASSVLLFLFVDHDAIILKPYEFISGSLIVLWAVFLLYSIYKNKVNWKSLIIFGITGGLLFLTFYFWFFLVAIAIALFNLFYRKIKLSEYLKFSLVGIIILLISSVYLVPLFLTYHNLGSENWQLGFTYIGRIKTFGPDLIFSFRGLLILFGFGTLIFYRKNLYNRTLLSLFIAPYIWQLLGLLTILFFASPLQESKGFMYLHAPILALAVGFGVEKVFSVTKKYFKSDYYLKTIQIIILYLVAINLIFGGFADNKAVHQTRQLARTPRAGVLDLVEYLKTEDIFETITLHAGVVELHSFLPLNSFIYYNMHVSHPAAHYSERLAFVKDLGLSSDAEEFYKKIKLNNFAKIKRLIFFKTQENFYSLYFHVDDFPNGSREEVVKFDKDLIGDVYFEKSYENNNFVVFKIK
jgi:galactan 5-O-arabinofuranosyltransferase